MNWDVTLFDTNGAAITGGAALVTLKIRRIIDNYIYDWNDSVFKNSSWTSPTSAGTEVDSTNLPGLYSWSTVISTWDDGEYQGIIKYSGYPVLNETMIVYIQDGKEINETIFDVASDIDTKTTNLPLDPASQSSVESAINNAVSGLSTLTSQNVRDSLKLTPTVGAPQSGSVDEYLSSINSQTSQLSFDSGKTIATLNGETVALDSGSITAIEGAISDGLLSYGVATTGDITTSEANIRGIDNDTLRTLSIQLDNLPTGVDTLLSSIHGSGAWTSSGVLPQDIRDALTLAATPGLPIETGSIDQLLTQTLADIFGLPSSIDELLTTNHGSGNWNSIGPDRRYY